MAWGRKKSGGRDLGAAIRVTASLAELRLSPKDRVPSAMMMTTTTRRRRNHRPNARPAIADDDTPRERKAASEQGKPQPQNQ